MLSTELSSEDLRPVIPMEATSFSVPREDSQAQLSFIDFADARQLLRKAECDIRDPNLFNGIRLENLSDDEMASLRDPLCGVLSLRPWSKKKITSNYLKYR